ncbi:MbtH family protein [Streptomyces rubradiris]|uniref:MbtH protein n=1 Tax=Streptomyces rubradiris TaxID=285531 RepID=A0ABQ3R823_STRRR|nr:MbtH family protein [Streptomyces rubradiris]GHH24523.1 MbtH protein [Streptomyces rubradiris]GHI51996.1 MbtH protein [Streptomyces rubradiris]
MANPFDDPDGVYQVLVNAEQQHSLWPQDIAVPAGWTPVFGPDTRNACVDYVESHWSDMRPAALRAAAARTNR